MLSVDDPDAFIRLWVGGCMSACRGPSYEVTVVADGRLHWAGYFQVGRLGPGEDRVDAAAVAKLFAAVESVDFEALARMRDTPACATDHGRAVLTVMRDGVEQQAWDDGSWSAEPERPAGPCNEPALALLREVQTRVHALVPKEPWMTISRCAVGGEVDRTFLPHDTVVVARQTDGTTKTRRLRGDPRERRARIREVARVLDERPTEVVRVWAQAEAGDPKDQRVQQARRQLVAAGVDEARITTWFAPDRHGFDFGTYVMLDVGPPECLGLAVTADDSLVSIPAEPADDARAR